jgi:hypothetical protein
MKSALLTLGLILLNGTYGPFILAADFPDADIQAYLAKHQAFQIPSRATPRLQRDVESRWLNWFERIVSKPFAERLKTDVATRDRAINLAQKGIMQIRQSPQRDPAFTAEVMVAECQALLKAGLNDPLIHWFHSRAIYQSTQDYPSFEAAHALAVKHPQFKEQPAAQRLLMLADFERIAQEARRSTSKMIPSGKEIIETAWLSIQGGTYQADEDEILNENLWPIFRKNVLPEDEARVAEISRLPSLSEWAKLMLTGQFHERKAWQARGGSFADKVSPEGWKGFEESRQQAVECFTKALKMQPDSLPAAYNLLGISLTDGNTSAEPQVWLDRVMDIQFDYLPTYRSLLNGLLPRWSGSHQKMLALGLSCAATKRFDTEVPYFFFEVLQALARDGADWRKFCRDPLVARVAVALCRQRLQDAPTPALKQEARTFLGAYGWLCGDYQTASEALALVPDKFSRALVLEMLPFHGWNEQVIRAESLIFSAGLEKEWLAATQALEEKNLKAAQSSFEKVRAKVTGLGAALTDSRMAQVKFESGLEGGGWVPLQVDPSLAGWQIQKGDWTGSNEGHLVNRGRGTSAFIYHLGRVGTEFQIRGQFKAGQSGLGILIGHGDDQDGVEKWITCAVKRGQAYFLDRYYSCKMEKRKAADLHTPTAFLITCHSGKITFELDGQQIFTEVEPAEYYAPHPPLRLIPDGHVGFCLSLFEKDNVSTVLNSEVRRLPADFKLK